MSAPAKRRKRVTGFYHAGITVRSIDASLAFYRDLLGLEVVRDFTRDLPFLMELVGIPAKSIRSVFLEITPTHFVELVEYHGVEQFPAAARPCDLGVGHTCLFIDDLEALHAELKRAGVKVRSEKPVTLPLGAYAGSKVLYVHDPDGYICELYELAPGLTAEAAAAASRQA
jgi:catechol 2,3-dioxygenase-like lactoylglutathione lyase family enzyme